MNGNRPGMVAATHSSVKRVVGVGMTSTFSSKFLTQTLMSALIPMPPTSTCSSAATDRARETAAFERNFASKHQVHNDEISQGQAHSECTPDQTDVQGVRPGKCFFNGDVTAGVVTGRQEVRVERNRCAYQHEGKIQAGTRERLVVILLSRKITDADDRK